MGAQPRASLWVGELGSTLPRSHQATLASLLCFWEGQQEQRAHPPAALPGWGSWPGWGDVASRFRRVCRRWLPLAGSAVQMQAATMLLMNLFHVLRVGMIYSQHVRPRPTYAVWRER